MLLKLMPDLSINEVLGYQERGLHYGDGLFETLLKIEGNVPYWDSHYQRLVKGCRQLHLPFPNQDWLESKVFEASKDKITSVIKIIVTRGNGGRGLSLPNPDQNSVFVFSYPYTPPDASPLKLSVCNTRLPINPNLAGLKHLNRLDYVLATIELSKKPNMDEGILCDLDGFIVEGIISNLFFCKNGQIFTPSLALAGVEGIMRAKIIEYLEKIGTRVYVDRFNLEHLFEADECFLCNSVQGVRSIATIDNHQFETGTITKSMISHFSHSNRTGI